MRSEPCVALYPTLNINRSWKFLNMETMKIVRRNSYVKSIHTPDVIVTGKGKVEAKDIDAQDNTGVGELDDVEQEDEPKLLAHLPDPNIVEISS